MHSMIEGNSHGIITLLCTSHGIIEQHDFSQGPANKGLNGTRVIQCAHSD
jgi:hypothetical protein